MAQIPLGPFLLDRPVGTGGMGTVWSAKHADQDVQVAVKVLSARVAREPELRAAFRNEVRAVAALHHANIVVVLDHGEVDTRAATLSEGHLPAGAPYLVMEYATHGSLYPWRGRLPWSRTREILLELLDALAHAHARGVIHRDLKPANVLLSGRSLRVKLTDFGLAHLTLKDGYTAPLDAGTPAFMAPEQLSEAWRDYGPWTDLYALGNIAAALVAGKPPLAELPIAKVYLRALSGKLPPVEPVIPVPDGFQDWLSRLLAPDHRERFQRAADAAWALVKLGGAPDPIDLADEFEVTDAPTMLLADSPSRTSLKGRGASGLLSFATDPEPTGRRAAEVRPPLPQDWRSDGIEAASIRVLGAGLGVYGLRTVPFVGRETERDALWSALAEVNRTGRPRVQLVRGRQGVGASRLCAWIAHRAHELGAVTVLRATHQSGGGAHHGLASMVVRHHALAGLDGDGLRNRLMDTAGPLDKLELEALVDYARPETPSPGDRPALRSRHATLAQHLRRLTTDPGGVPRPLLLVLDDVHCEPETLAFLEWMLEGDRELPVLVLATCPSEGEIDSATAEQVEKLAAGIRVEVVEIGPLAKQESAQLVGELLGLERALADVVTTHTAGVPLHAIQLVGTWVDNEWLVTGSGGFALHTDAPPLIADASEVGPEGLRALLDSLDADVATAIELGACLGRAVSWVEWDAVCGGVSPREAVEALVERRYARIDDEGWGFTHDALRDAVLERARASGRLETNHARCATALLACFPRGTRGVDRRVANHFDRAGQPDNALEAWTRAVPISRVFEAASVVHEVCTRALATLDTLGAAPDDSRRLKLRIQLAEHLREVARYDESVALAQEIEQLAAGAGLTARVAESVACQGHSARQRGDLPRARELLSRAIDGFAESRRIEGLVSSLVALGIVERRLGSLDEAMQLLDRAADLYRRLDAPLGRGMLQAEYGNVWSARGRLVDANRHYEAARELLEKAGWREGLAYVLNSLGWIALKRGDHDAASTYLTRSREIYEQLESPQAVIPDSNFAAIELAQGRVTQARERMERALVRYQELDWRIYAATTRLELLIPLALLGDWEPWDEHLDRGGEAIRALETAEDEVADICERAAQIALEAGEVKRARKALDLAREQWEELGRPLRAHKVAKAIEALP